MDNVGVVIPAAGSGKRMGTGLKKQFLELDGLPVLAHTLKIFQLSERVSQIVVAGAKEDIDKIWEIVKAYRFSKVTEITAGGSERQESVYAGVKALSATVKRVVVHDGARPLLTLDNFRRFLETSEGVIAAVTAIPLKDTVKRISSEGWVLETPLREQLRAVQTPQVFDRLVLEEAHEHAVLEGFRGTDDSALIEWRGYPVLVLEGWPENIKITTPEDLWLAERFLLNRHNDDS